MEEIKELDQEQQIISTYKGRHFGIIKFSNQYRNQNLKKIHFKSIFRTLLRILTYKFPNTSNIHSRVISNGENETADDYVRVHRSKQILYRFHFQFTRCKHRDCVRTNRKIDLPSPASQSRRLKSTKIALRIGLTSYLPRRAYRS